MYRAAGLRVGRARRARTWPSACDAWAAAAAAVPARHRVELLASPPTCSAASSRWPPASRSTSSSRERIFEPARHDRHRLLRAATPTPTGSPRSTRPTRRPARRSRIDALGRRRARRRRRSCRGGGGLVSHRRRLPPVHPDAARRGGELDGVRLLGPRTVALHGPQPPARRRRPRGVRPAALRRDAVRRASASASGFAVVLDPVASQGAGQRGRARLGRRGQHRVLGRPGRGARPSLFFTQLLPSSTYPIRAAAAPARLPGAGGLTGAAPRDARGPQGPLERLHRLLGPTRLRAHAAAGRAAGALHLGRGGAGTQIHLADVETPIVADVGHIAVLVPDYAGSIARPCARPGTR